MSDERYEYKPRRPLYDEEPDGYMESPNDYVRNNVWLAERLLDAYGAGLIQLPHLEELE